MTKEPLNWNWIISKLSIKSEFKRECKFDEKGQFLLVHLNASNQYKISLYKTEDFKFFLVFGNCNSPDMSPTPTNELLSQMYWTFIRMSTFLIYRLVSSYHCKSRSWTWIPYLCLMETIVRYQRRWFSRLPVCCIVFSMNVFSFDNWRHSHWIEDHLGQSFI